MPALARITVYPVKSLDGCARDSAVLGDHGALELDREYAMVDSNGAYVNGKATAAVHRLRSRFDPDTHELILGVCGEETERVFDLEADRAALHDWLSEFFDEPVTVERDAGGGYPDDTDIHGPTVISTGTVRAVADWFDLPPENVRRRFRANLEIDATEPFWEDRLFADHGESVAFSVGGVTLLGVNPCQRCVVPSRDPDTGEELSDFRARFVEHRETTLPPWTESDRFDHPFRLMLNTHVPEAEWGSTLSVGDSVTVGEVRSFERA
jgi:uncharacterized protein YcbX